MIIFPKFVRHPSLAFGMKLADDGAGSQPTRGPRNETGGPRPLFTVPPAQPPRRKQGPPADSPSFPNNVGRKSPREGGTFTVPPKPSDRAEAEPSRGATPTAREGGAASLKFLQGAERGEADVREIAKEECACDPSWLLPCDKPRANCLHRPVEDWHPLDELAALIRSLTYGEMLALAAAIARVRGPIAQQQELPPALHLWATEGR